MKLVIKSPVRGFAKDFAGSNNGASIEGINYEYARSTGIDLFRPGFYGHITPAEVFSTASISNANITSHFRGTAVDVNQGTGFVYGILQGKSGTAPRIERIESGTYQSTASHAIVAGGGNFTSLPSGTGAWGDDIILYNVSGTGRMFYSYRDSAGGDVGTATLTAGGAAPTYNDVFFSSTLGLSALTADVPILFAVGPNNKLYVTNGRYLIEYDGLNNTVVAQKYDAGPGWVITDVRVYKTYLVIVSQNCGLLFRSTISNEGSRVCLWNMDENGLGLVYYMRDGIASAAFVDEFDRLYVFTQGKTATVRLRKFNGSAVEVVKEYQYPQYGTPPYRNSIESYKGLLYWIAGNSAGGYVLGYDPSYNGLHAPYFLNDGSNDATSGMVLKNVDENGLYASLLVGATYKLCNLNGFSAYATNRDFRTRLYELPYEANIKKILVFFSQKASGSSAQFSLFKGHTTMSVGTAGVDFLNKTISYSASDTRVAYSLGRSVSKVSSFYMNFRMSGQISIERVEVYFEPSQT